MHDQDFLLQVTENVCTKPHQKCFSGITDKAMSDEVILCHLLGGVIIFLGGGFPSKTIFRKPCEWSHFSFYLSSAEKTVTMKTSTDRVSSPQALVLKMNTLPTGATSWISHQCYIAAHQCMMYWGEGLQCKPLCHLGNAWNLCQHLLVRRFELCSL